MALIERGDQLAIRTPDLTRVTENSQTTTEQFSCYQGLPDPKLALTGTEDYSVGNKQFTRYKLAVTNWNLYPAELFNAAPDLPPCGFNTESSRTWVNIYDQDDNDIYGFCALNSPGNLMDIWFAVERGNVPPEAVYVVLNDRRCNLNYRSNLVSIEKIDDDIPVEIYFADARSSPGSVYRYIESPPTTHSTGPVNISQTWTVDLDEGAYGPSSGADIWFHAVTADERYLEPMNGAKIAKVSLPGSKSCLDATFSSSRIEIDDLTEGSYVCVITDEGRLSQLRVNMAAGPSPGVLGIGYITWEIPTPGTSAGTDGIIYTRPSKNLYSFTFHPAIPEKLYYVNANENNIFRTAKTGTGWSPEETVYTHKTYVRDLAFLFDQEGELHLYFSEASGAGDDGIIYEIKNNVAVPYRVVSLSEVGGFWAGNFAFDDDGTLYLSTGNRIPASIYRVDDGSVTEIFRDDRASIKGMAYKDGAIYYANWKTKIYCLDLATSKRSIVYVNPKREWISDVGFRGETDPIAVTAVLSTTTA